MAAGVSIVVNSFGGIDPDHLHNYSIENNGVAIYGICPTLELTNDRGL